MDPINESAGKLKTELKCVVCGSDLYSTDRGYQEVTYHCSSAEARFWDFDRGTAEQNQSKEHWDRSKLEIFFRQN